MFWGTRYPMISKTGSGRVGFRKKFRVAGRVQVPAGHWSYYANSSWIFAKEGILGGSTPTTLHFTCWLCIQHHLQRHPCFVTTGIFASLQAWRIKTQVASFTIGQLDRIGNVDNCPMLHCKMHSRIQDENL